MVEKIPVDGGLADHVVIDFEAVSFVGLLTVCCKLLIKITVVTTVSLS